MELGKKIRQLRYKADLTQEQLAEKLNIAAQSVSKWENGMTMPDISTLPLLAEIFGVTIDDLFDLTVEQRLNRIENRMDAEDELPQDVFLEYEAFLKTQLEDAAHHKRAQSLIAYLYWHKMNSYARKASRYAKQAVRLSPGEKDCQWILSKTDGHAIWDWNMANHTQAIDFYKEIVEKEPQIRLPYLYLLDNLIADRRTKEADLYLDRLCALKDTRPIINEVYRAHIALARFDEQEADRIIEQLLQDHREEDGCLFEAAQYYAGKCEYEKATELYEESFEKTKRRPRFQDELLAIRDICIIRGDCRKAAETIGRIITLLEEEWGIKDTDEIRSLKKKKAELLEKA